MSDEPGVSLGRLIATERNALTAISGQKAAEVKIEDLTRNLYQMQVQVALLQEQITALQVRLASMMGNGPTRVENGT